MNAKQAHSNGVAFDKYDDPLKEPKTAFGILKERQYKAELELVDRYQSFVAELLRLSLLGIAVFGFLYTNIFSKPSVPASELHTYAKWLAATSVLMFGASAAFALVFRFFATEGVRFYIEALRFFPDNEDYAQKSLNKRYWKILICIWSKVLAAVFLGLGGVLAAIAFCLLLIKS